MRALFSAIPTAEEEIRNVKNYFKFFSFGRLTKKLAIMFSITTAISCFGYCIFLYGEYKVSTFIILCSLFSLMMMALSIFYELFLHNVALKSYQIPGTQKAFYNVSLNDIYSLIEDDIKIHESVKTSFSSDEDFYQMEEFRFNFICNAHFSTWRQLNEEIYKGMLCSGLSKDELEGLKNQQEIFKTKLLKTFENIPNLCKEVEEWYEKFQKAIK